MTVRDILIDAKNWDMHTYIDYVDIDKNEVVNINTDVKISTMCTSCKLNSKLNIYNIENYMQLNHNTVLSIKSSNIKQRTLIPLIQKPRRLTKYICKLNKNISENKFYNQVTIIMRVTHGDSENLSNEPKINMKLFKNGSIQMSGCKTIKNINIVLNKLLYCLQEIKAILEDNVIIEKPFIDNIDTLTILSFKIDMINCNYKLDIQIDRNKLYNLLIQQKVKCIYEPCIRACVIIKYMPSPSTLKGISIFIFQRGNVIITGAKSKMQVLDTYNYVNNIINTNKNIIIQRNEKEEEELILKIYSEILNDIRLGLN